jgi:hypothetical protein
MYTRLIKWLRIQQESSTIYKSQYIRASRIRMLTRCSSGAANCLLPDGWFGSGRGNSGRGVSGTKPLTSRPGGSRLLHLIKTKKVQHVVALKLDRLFRNASDASILLRHGISKELVCTL